MNKERQAAMVENLKKTLVSVSELLSMYESVLRHEQEKRKAKETEDFMNRTQLKDIVRICEITKSDAALDVFIKDMPDIKDRLDRARRCWMERAAVSSKEAEIRRREAIKIMEDVRDTRAAVLKKEEFFGQQDDDDKNIW